MGHFLTALLKFFDVWNGAVEDFLRVEVDLKMLFDKTQKDTVKLRDGLEVNNTVSEDSADFIRDNFEELFSGADLISEKTVDDGGEVGWSVEVVTMFINLELLLDAVEDFDQERSDPLGKVLNGSFVRSFKLDLRVLKDALEVFRVNDGKFFVGWVVNVSDSAVSSESGVEEISTYGARRVHGSYNLDLFIEINEFEIFIVETSVSDDLL
jgi:hypothetical protein